MRVRSNVGVPIPLAIGVDMASVHAKTEVTVDRKEVILPPRRTHAITVSAVPRAEDYEVNDDCRLLVGVGSASQVHYLPIHIKVVRPKFVVVDNGLTLVYVPSLTSVHCALDGKGAAWLFGGSVGCWMTSLPCLLRARANATGTLSLLVTSAKTFALGTRGRALPLI